jgi:tRNA pseudouridine38-40 synthase
MNESPPVQSAAGTLGLERRPGRLLAECSYLGAFFQGWQVQGKGERTVQGTVEGALRRMYKAPVGVTVAGRTDTLVSARQQFFHFDPPFAIPLDGLAKGMNTLLPWDVRIHQIVPVPPEFDARTAVVSKTYVYRLQRGGVLSPFDALTVHLWHGRLDAGTMREAARLLSGERDFRPFTVQPETYRTTVRRVEAVELAEEGDRLVFTVRAEGFMRYMVRRIVGTLVEVGRGARTVEWVRGLVEMGVGEAGPTIDARGLCLEAVEYRDISQAGEDESLSRQAE